MHTFSPSRLAAVAAVPVLLLIGCGGGSTGATINTSTTPGTLIENPPLRTASLTATDLNAELNATPTGVQLLTLATGSPTGAVPYGVDVYYIQYQTVGGAGETATATGALIVPTGFANGAPVSLGARPIILYAHGTETLKAFNMANFVNPVDTSNLLVAALFAANGYIVVAPNYAGYDTSSLPYHPYLNAKQQSGDMINSLQAARTALSSGGLFSTAPTDNGQLFVTGYSQGGHVAMATVQAMQAANMTVTASAPCSGPYALAAFGDTLVSGDVDFGSTVFAPLVTSSYHNSYKGVAAVGDIYNLTGTAADVYVSTLAPTIDTLLPGTVDIDAEILAGTYPSAIFNNAAVSAADLATGVTADGFTGATATQLEGELTELWPSLTPPPGNPLFAAGFGASPNNLWLNSYRAGILADAIVNPDGAVPTATTEMPTATAVHPIRRAFALNDLRGAWAPTAPMQMIGGHNDPEVFYTVNTSLMYGIWSSQSIPTVLAPFDIDPGISFTTLGNAAGLAFATDLGNGITDPATFAADINTAVAASLAPGTNGISATPNQLQAGFLQATAEAVATEITPTNLSGIFMQVTGTATPTLAQLGANATAIGTAIGTATATIVTEAYHGNLVLPFAHVAALQFFNNFVAQ